MVNITHFEIACLGTHQSWQSQKLVRYFQVEKKIENLSILLNTQKYILGPKESLRSLDKNNTFSSYD
jgi:hypothetical protein